MKIKTEHIILGIILAAAFFLRFFHFDEWSLSNDELSAWLRLQYGSVGEVIEKGVRPDFHPAGIQVFLYYWTALCGDSPFALRLPFVILGTASVWLIYVLGKRWFGTGAGLMSAALLAILQLPVLYSQIARPYASGMFLALLLTYFWTRVLKDEKLNWKMETGLALSLALNMYNHYFSVLFAGLICLSGLLLLNKSNWKGYMISCAAGIALFFPHLWITLEQLDRGGLSSWLGAPEPDHILRFLNENLYQSTWLLLLLLSALIFAWISGRDKIRLSRLHFIGIGVFVASYLIGYFYSVYKNPVLQHSVLLFSFPLFILFFGSFFAFLSEKIAGILSIVILMVGSTLLFTSSFHEQKPFSEFKGIILETKGLIKDQGPENVEVFYNAIAPEYLRYYQERSDSFRFTFRRGDDSAFISTLQQCVEESEKPYFVYAWTNSAHPEEIFPVIMHKYRGIHRRVQWFNSEFYVFSNDSAGEMCFKRELFLDPPPEKANKFEEYPTLEQRLGIYQMKPENEFTEYINTPLAYFCDSCEHILCEFEFSDPDKLGELVMVTELRVGDSLHHWQGANFRQFAYKDSLGKYRLHSLTRIPKERCKEATLKVYLWNKGKMTLRPHRLMLYSNKQLNKISYDP